MLLGLRTVVYKVGDIDRAKRWYSDVFRIAPYFDEPFYVGFNVGGYELGLDPDTHGTPPGPGGSVGYWGVADLAAALERLTAAGVEIHTPLHDVGDGILTASIRDPFGNVIGLIQNPHFALPPSA